MSQEAIQYNKKYHTITYNTTPYNTTLFNCASHTQQKLVSRWGEGKLYWCRDQFNSQHCRWQHPIHACPWCPLCGRCPPAGSNLRVHVADKHVMQILWRWNTWAVCTDICIVRRCLTLCDNQFCELTIEVCAKQSYADGFPFHSLQR